MADVGNVEVDCVNDFFNVGVTVNGLAPGNSVFLENNGGDLLEVSSNNSLTNFSIQVGNGLEYLVTFFSQPTTPNQTCQFTTPSTGTINGTDAAVIQVECVTESYFIGGTVSGLLDGNYMVIQNNKGDDEIIMSNGAYLFSTPLFDEENYNVQIFMQPVNPIQPCIVDNNSSNLAGFDVDDVDINCEIGNDFIFRNGFEGLPLTF